MPFVAFSKFDTEKARLTNGTTGYQILQVASADRYTKEFTLPADWPSNWAVKYTSNGAYLHYLKGTKIIVR